MKKILIVLFVVGLIALIAYNLIPSTNQKTTSQYPPQQIPDQASVDKSENIDHINSVVINEKPKNITKDKLDDKPTAENNSSKVNLTNQIPTVSEKAFPASNGHSAIILKLNETDKKAFREIDVEGRKTQKVLSLGKMTGEPNTIVGPISLQTKPNKPIFLRAIDKGVFTNGAPEIFVKADEKGLVQVDFKFGIGYGPYRVLIQAAGCATEQVTFTCQPKEVQLTEAKNIIIENEKQ